ncbi:chromatin associated protein KTI12 [Entophlyctis helioformis]|nr:chromatin associated protein KTI12 [Entophlyctis helioformis]
MPLVTICGVPLSGKTTRATELASFLESYIQREQAFLQQQVQQHGVSVRSKVIVLNDESLRIDKRTGYADATEEKKSRGALLSAVERHLSKDDIVVCDGLNYIKGFRYQLYCVARALGTPTCTIHSAISVDAAKARNDTLATYETGLFDNLCSRFEEPDGRNRWDAPLFTLIPDDPSLSHLPPQDDAGNQPLTPIQSQIIDAILLRKPPAPNLSTVVKPLTETNYLHEMDKTTSAIIEAVADAQKNGLMGNVTVPKTKLQIRLPSRTIPLTELRRLRRQYTQLNKMHTQLSMDKVAEGFADYLNTNLA